MQVTHLLVFGVQMTMVQEHVEFFRRVVALETLERWSGHVVLDHVFPHLTLPICPEILTKRTLEFQATRATSRSSRVLGVHFLVYFEPVRVLGLVCLLYTSPSPRDLSTSRMPSSA